MARIQFQRFLGVSPRLNAYLTKTTLSPQNFQLVPPKFDAKSLIVFSTGNNLSKVIEETIKLHENSKVSIFVAGIDSIINSNRDGVSELWLDEQIQIKDQILLEEKDGPKELKESDGINIVTARTNWKNIDSSLSLNFGSDNVSIRLSNTIFQTGNLVTLYYLNHSSGSGQLLSDLSLDLPLSIKTIETKDKWVKLTSKLKITDFKGNLLKSINNKSAASFLETNEKLMSLKSKETEVYCKIYRNNIILPLKYKVIAGGGGWGSKAHIIAISPQAKIQKGDEIEFYMLTPEDKITLPELDLQQFKDNFTFESSYEELGYTEKVSQQQVIENTFGCGSEKGFTVNNIDFVSNGESAMVKVK